MRKDNKDGGMVLASIRGMPSEVITRKEFEVKRREVEGAHLV